MPAPTSHVPSDHDRRGFGRARRAAAAPFFLTGLLFASYFVQIPSLKLDLGLSEGRLGVFLMLPVLSGLAAMQLTGRLVGRFGSGPVVRTTTLALPLALLAFALVADQVTFGLVLLMFGAIDGLMDIAMNAHAVAVERARHRPIMNACHAGWSIGAAAGSLLGGAALAAGLSLAQHFLLITAVTVAMALITGRHLLPAHTDRSPQQPRPAQRTGWWTGWTSRVLLLGATGVLVFVISGVVGSWSGVFLHEDLGASLGTASLGYICYNVCEAGARLLGDRFQERLGPSILVRISGLIAVTGLVVVVFSRVPGPAIAGFAILGLGLAVLIPIILSAAGHDGASSDTSNAAAALSKVGTLTYSGQLLGPMAVGWSAGAFGMPQTFAGLTILLAAALIIATKRCFPSLPVRIPRN
ncbi:MFS transporter [Nonomuraea sp. SYSU D8015]|uniref:MFS transporter n=1 Tax=Nonomuraea sp. SYSU D8015 TaxID=2593644 RepID=UPI001660B03C|nr:MFS transporter [Nonomuraea sp. SYSU D8015]